MSSMFPPITGYYQLILIDTIYTITVLYGIINCYSVIPIYSQLYGLWTPNYFTQVKPVSV